MYKLMEGKYEIWGQVLKYNNNLKDIAEYVGIHYTTVSRAIKKNEGEDEKCYCKT
jgi:DNA-binding MarR family transcriptional regulator